MIKVTSEIGKLKTVLLHRPGKELENLTPDVLEKLLFDDIPYLKVAQEEHDLFADTLRKEGVEVLYLVDMVTEALDAHPEVMSSFINSFIEESKIKSHTIKNALYQFLVSQPTKQMILKMIEGIRTNEVVIPNKNSIMDMLEDEYPFYTDPIPNILFQRDPFSSVGFGVAMSKMSTQARQRETIFAEYMINYHPRFQGKHIPYIYHRLNRYPLEGGDILVLSKGVVAMGISSRTDPRAIEFFAERLFEVSKDFHTVLAFNIPKSRAFMHLDTVFTQVDYGTFTIHPGIENILTVFEIEKNEQRFSITKVVTSLETVLEKHLKRPITLIRCGGKDQITSVREQWNDGANTLAIAPGKVIVYDRNHVTNQMLSDAGITVLEIESSELSRGRGGPRCMSMPLEREDIE
ncbi:MAG: arginine deiminase [Tenericutes bacterium GWC2_34_14]|nr:MAG: arginine deiminase [Tenericutes bacterium GWC2_34_14]OHE35005.1 MAG: arginine deiminase [Tenericutes bacterium GWE2_34_108]OHE37135.1 MAG: arginine deiminase [Tenericutes bacterium GWF1_35_14]OHE39733.1 MAG: arginine deiminase [Tenericutes bacterium GWF2_35_184]OHE44079.1 MAG: arginine deiminase [Tenericutes bacterium RIFOXYA2_FULL_36_32]OHE44671.1 MAG: arginine deiminase [Tenericutes bacterium RIFOXYA12_FULL_35_10]OHE47495.1 MAG: arginine deiminase [Tenericutes bacterium RIFOXYB2_FUL